MIAGEASTPTAPHNTRRREIALVEVMEKSPCVGRIGPAILLVRAACDRNAPP
jgi:hypothetical protein